MYLPTLSASCLLVALTLLWTWKPVCLQRNIFCTSVRLISKKYDLGFDKDQVLTVPFRGQLATQRDVFKSRVLQIPGVLKASNANTVPGIGHNETFFAFEGFNLGKPKVFPYTEADEDYRETLGIELAEGRFFSKKFPVDNKSIVINETLAREVGWTEPLGKIVRMSDVIEDKLVEVPYTVIGVVKDFHHESLREKVRGFLILLSPDRGLLSVKVRPENAAGIIRDIEKIWKEMSLAGRLFCDALLAAEL